MSSRHRIRALLWFILAAIYYVVARGVASVAAGGLSSGIWFDFVDRAILLFLLIVGYSAMAYVGQRQQHPVAAMGLARRAGVGREFALGAAIGWTGMAACALIIAIFGGMVIFFYTNWRQFAEIPLDILILLIAALAQEVAFRGYPFQRLIEATGPLFATFAVSILYGLAHITNDGASPASFIVAMLAGWVLSIAYLRTRALWVSWGIHFAWIASMSVLFGFPLVGITRYSPVISSTALGPTWLTGFDYGPEGSAIAIVVMLGLIVLTLYATRGLSWEYAQPAAVPVGSPDDVPAPAPPRHEPIIVPPPTPPPSEPIIVPPPKSEPIITPPPTPTGPLDPAVEPPHEQPTQSREPEINQENTPQ
ncbi:MAG: lysostaphin resistance A-like protein [Acidobacteriaceae bacterium]